MYAIRNEQTNYHCVSSYSLVSTYILYPMIHGDYATFKHHLKTNMNKQISKATGLALIQELYIVIMSTWKCQKMLYYREREKEGTVYFLFFFLLFVLTKIVSEYKPYKIWSQLKHDPGVSMH